MRMIMRVEQFLSDSAARHGSRPAVVCNGRSHSYADLARASDRVAAAMAARGIGRGARVALYMDDNFEAVVAAFAVLKVGAVATLIEVASSSDEVAAILQRTGAVALATEARLASAAAIAMAKVRSVRLVLLRGGDKATANANCLVFEEIASGIGPAQKVDRVGPASDLALQLHALSADGEPAESHLTHADVIAAAGAGGEGTRMLSSIFSYYGMCQLIAAVRAGTTLVLETPSVFRRALSAGREGGEVVPALAG
jgi:acyl-CoA synthetase (AMP-forming)/AMP-acid ligase II